MPIVSNASARIRSSEAISDRCSQVAKVIIGTCFTFTPPVKSQPDVVPFWRCAVCGPDQPVGAERSQSFANHQATKSATDAAGRAGQLRGPRGCSTPTPVTRPQSPLDT